MARTEAPLPGVEALPDGRGRALIYQGRDATGKRRYTRRTYPSVKLANDAKRDALRARARGQQIADQGTTVRELATRWLALPSPRRGEATRRLYELALDHHVYPALGNTRLDRLSVRLLHQHFDELAQLGRGVPSLRMAYNALSGALKQAVAWGLIERNPCVGVILPTHRPDNPAAPATLAEARALLARCPDEPETGGAIALMLLTGLRTGEAQALGWDAVDVERGLLHVRRHLSTDRAGVVVIASGAKSRAGERAVKLGAEAVAVLKRQRARQNEWRLAAGHAWPEWGLVFTRATGEALSRHDVTAALARLCAAVGMARLTPHDLRSTHATLVAEVALEIELVALQQRLGHTSRDQTMAYVRQRDAEMQRDLAARLDERLRREGAGD